LCVVALELAPKSSNDALAILACRVIEKV
jgi:hypothetical protein